MIQVTDIYVAVIDDDESFRRSLVRLLRAAHYQPLTYPSAEEFLADTKHPRFDCMLLDIALGGISGLELGRRLAASGSTVPIVYITAHDDAKTRAEAQAVGCTGFVSKIEPRDVLLDAVARAVKSAH
ncbi:MAG: response regulator [Candidatus Krumholzibacteria bacterium]|nr:response regulator [Candidatus Krumholzibacteria bacterium]MDH4337725.1 response regulator [Candidatus Krumholzibacteria bacterium]MDH5270647.1 response regulator [Candidatus Krumholzibacteria bacterium]